MGRSFEGGVTNLFVRVSHFYEVHFVAVSVLGNNKVLNYVTMTSDEAFLFDEAGCGYQIVVPDSVVNTAPKLIDCVNVGHIFYGWSTGEESCCLGLSA